jgi:glycosyltransferase involved in cell wall biosynthesis
MKITFPALTLCIGGAQRMLVELANGLAARGHDITILMPRTGDIEYKLRAKVMKTKNDYFLYESDYPKGDLIVSNYYLVVPSAQQASQNGKGVHVRLSLCYEPTFLKDNHKTYPTYHMTRNVMVLSQWQQQIIALNHGVQGHIVPVGVSHKFRNLQLRKNNNSLVITAIVRKPEGGFSWHREQDYLVRELAKVKSRFPQVKLNLLCPANELASSPSLQKLSKTKMFTFYSPKNDQEMCYRYNQADIFVVSSIYDAACLPGIEAMRCGAALVTTYCGGNTDYARHQENCLMSYRFENRLGKDIIRLIQNPALRQKIAKKGEQEAAKWTWQRSISAFEKAIENL